jgi:hypothetical protein
MRASTAAGFQSASVAAAAAGTRLRASAPVVANWGRALVPTWRPSLPVTRKQQMVWAGAAVAILLAVAAAVVVVSRAAIPPAGTLVIDAVPWGTVAAIESDTGQRMPLPTPASTPLAISLPAGTYQVLVTGPPPESQEQRLTVRVDPNGSSVAPLARFRVITPEEYFEPYLTAPASPDAPGTSPADSAGVAAPQPPVAPATAQTPVPAGENR